MSEATGLLEVAIEAARAAAAVLREGRTRAVEAREKDGSPTSIVTWADLRSQEEIARVILDRNPGDAVVGEEGTSGDPSGRHVWYVDPVDGTTNYAHGFPHYCVSIAFRDAEGVALGVVYDPERDDLFVAARDGEPTHNGSPMRVSKVGELRRALLSTQVQSDDPEEMDRYAARVRRFAGAARASRSLGSPALSLAYVARGWLDAFCEPRLAPWDTLAGALMVERAGGRVTTFDGSPRPSDRRVSIAASNARLHSGLLELLYPEAAEAGAWDWPGQRPPMLPLDPAEDAIF
jgi:myo-inositol-1(or 4)-monophosphatase